MASILRAWAFRTAGSRALDSSASTSFSFRVISRPRSLQSVSLFIGISRWVQRRRALLLAMLATRSAISESTSSVGRPYAPTSAPGDGRRCSVHVGDVGRPELLHPGGVIESLCDDLPWRLPALSSWPPQRRSGGSLIFHKPCCTGIALTPLRWSTVGDRPGVGDLRPGGS